MPKILKSDSLESTTISSTKDASLVFSTRPSDVLTSRLTITSGGNVGIGNGVSPDSILELYGAGSTSSSPSTSASLGATLALQDSAGATGNGGMVMFGASTGFFAAIKGYFTNSSSNTTGDLLFCTRNAVGDSTLTERLRITAAGGISFGASGTAYGSSGQVLISAGNLPPTWATYSTLTLNTSGTGLSGSTTYTPAGAATFTVTSNATSANTVSTIVARDGSGNFSAGTITATLTGNVTGTVTGNCTGSSGSCTGNAATSSSCSGNSATATTAAGLSTSSVYAIDTSTTTYGSYRVTGAKGSYVGTEYSYNSNLNTLMFDSSGNGGLFNYSAWPFYYHKANACLGIGTSSTSSSYVLYVFGRTVGAAVNSIYAEGNIVAYSDERVKKNWQNLTPNFIEKLSKVKSGVYERIDAQGAKQVGVSAQSLREVMPEAVIENTDDRKLGVSYGNAALAACVELAKEIVDLKEQIKNLKK